MKLIKLPWFNNAFCKDLIIDAESILYIAKSKDGKDHSLIDPFCLYFKLKGNDGKFTKSFYTEKERDEAYDEFIKTLDI